MATKCGAIVCHLRPEEVHPDGLFDAVLYNLDDVPRAERSALLEGLRRGNPIIPRRSTATTSPMSRPGP